MQLTFLATVKDKSKKEINNNKLKSKKLMTGGSI